MTLNGDLDDQHVQRLQDAARRLKISVYDVEKAAINVCLRFPIRT